MKKIFFILLVGAIGYAAFIYKTRPTSIYPYPYFFTSTTFDKKDSAEEASVLFIGDRMTVRLEKYLKGVIKRTSLNLKKPLKVVSIAKRNEGLHRTVHKLKGLKKLPSLIFYHGASEEFYEKRFLTKDSAALDKNFEIFADDKMLSMIMTVPTLSKFIYSPMSYYKLDQKIEEDKTEYPAKYKQIQMEMGIKLFQHELTELITLTKEHNSTLVLMTTPVNHTVGPRKVCDNAISTTMIQEQQDIELLIKDGDSKSAYIKAKKLVTATPGNARSYKLMGDTLIGLGRFAEARYHYDLSAANDCETWRANGVFNAIIRQQAQKYDIKLIDFDEMVNRNLGRNETFLTDIFPQEIYYEELVKVLELTTVALLKI